MTQLTIVARILAKSEKRDFVKSELLKLVEPTRTEPGCISYDLHQDIENENLFVFIERWESAELLEQHANNTPLQEFSAATEGAIAEFIVHKLEHIA